MPDLIRAVVVDPAADDSGFPIGTRLVGFLLAGAWAELVAVPTDSIASHLTIWCWIL